MKIKKILALAVSVAMANFLAFNLYMVFIVYKSQEFHSAPLFRQGTQYVDLAIQFFSYGLPISIIVVAIIGWPLYWVASRYGLVNCFTASCGGMAITVVPLIICKYTGWNLPSFSDKNGLMLVLSIAFCGFFGGIIFCKLIKK